MRVDSRRPGVGPQTSEPCHKLTSWSAAFLRDDIQKMARLIKRYNLNPE